MKYLKLYNNDAAFQSDKSAGLLENVYMASCKAEKHLHLNHVETEPKWFKVNLGEIIYDSYQIIQIGNKVYCTYEMFPSIIKGAYLDDGIEIKKINLNESETVYGFEIPRSVLTAVQWDYESQCPYDWDDFFNSDFIRGEHTIYFKKFISNKIDGDLIDNLDISYYIGFGFSRVNEVSDNFLDGLYYVDMPVIGSGDIVLFHDCDFSSIIIPPSMKHMGAGMFYNCNNITDLTIGDNVEYLSGDCCVDTYINYIVPADTNKNITIVNDVIMTYDQTEILGYIGDSYTLPSGDLRFGKYAFTNYKEYVFDFPQNTKYIGDYVLSGCSHIECIRYRDNEYYPNGYDDVFNVDALYAEFERNGVEVSDKAFYGTPFER